MGRHAEVDAGPLTTTGQVVRPGGDIEEAIDEAGRLATFRGLTNSYQRELVSWVEDVEGSAREQRIERLIEILAEQPTA